MKGFHSSLYFFRLVMGIVYQDLDIIKQLSDSVSFILDVRSNGVNCWFDFSRINSFNLLGNLRDSSINFIESSMRLFTFAKDSLCQFFKFSKTINFVGQNLLPLIHGSHQFVPNGVNVFRRQFRVNMNWRLKRSRLFHDFSVKRSQPDLVFLSGRNFFASESL